MPANAALISLQRHPLRHPAKQAWQTALPSGRGCDSRAGVFQWMVNLQRKLVVVVKRPLIGTRVVLMDTRDRASAKHIATRGRPWQGDNCGFCSGLGNEMAGGASAGLAAITLIRGNGQMAR